MKPNDILKRQFLQVVDNQLNENNPPETGETLQRLIKEGYNREEARLLIAQCVALEIYEIMKTDQPFKNERYVQNLKKLPQTPSEKTDK